jgi:uncharacterized glyoxalase superfamily protein PhnB
MSERSRPTLASGLAYRDPAAALSWLEKAFGFEITMVVENPDGSIGHSEMRLGDALIYVGREWDEHHRSPVANGGVNTQSLHIQLPSGIDAHFAVARAAGAKVLREPEDQFYGDRNYVVADPEGHIWSFGQTIKAMTFAEMQAAGGRPVRDHL